MSCELNMLSDIARIKLQAAYSYFVSGHKHKLIHIMRIIPSIFHQLEKTNHQLILTNFIPAITKYPQNMVAWVSSYFPELAGIEFQNSQIMSESLRNKIIE